jgi:hypothetical protein
MELLNGARNPQAVRAHLASQRGMDHPSANDIATPAIRIGRQFGDAHQIQGGQSDDWARIRQHRFNAIGLGGREFLHDAAVPCRLQSIRDGGVIGFPSDRKGALA